MSKISIAVHGGAGTILKSVMTDEKERHYKQALTDALNAGFEILKSGGSSTDAVTTAVTALENSPLFNAGRGSVFNHQGKHEMDASLMRGDTLAAGAVACITHIKNPILLAKAVMEQSGHVLLCAEGAMQFAKSIGFSFEPDEYFFDQLRYEQWQSVKGTSQTMLDHTDKKFGTVGAVALDEKSNLAAATSTGGMTNKRWGRVGDTPLIGSGTYANNKTCAVSCTGDGEFFMRGVTAYDVSCLMEYKGLSLSEAAQHVINDKMVKLGGEGGLIAIDARGSIHMIFNSKGMYRASRNAEGTKAEIY